MLGLCREGPTFGVRMKVWVDLSFHGWRLNARIVIPYHISHSIWRPCSRRVVQLLEGISQGVVVC